jgi:hypothetical protein
MTVVQLPGLALNRVIRTRTCLLRISYIVATDILNKLSDRGYHWFDSVKGGWLRPASLDKAPHDGNPVAIPEERIDRFRTYWVQAQDAAKSESGAKHAR